MTGRQVTAQAPAEGHTVTAATRHPEDLPLGDALLRVAVADVLDPVAVERAVAGQDAVISALGVPYGRKPVTVYSEGVTRVRRLVCVSSTVLFGVAAPGETFFFRKVLEPAIAGTVGRTVYEDMRRMEEIVRDGDHRWTVVRPAGLFDTDAVSPYRAAAPARPVHLPRGSGQRAAARGGRRSSCARLRRRPYLTGRSEPPRRHPQRGLRGREMGPDPTEPAASTAAAGRAVPDRDGPSDAATRPFVDHRELLFSVVHHMLGSVADTEDVLQETWLSWSGRNSRTPQPAIGHPRAYPVRTAVNHALARREAVALRRETYVGAWLPEPLVADTGDQTLRSGSVSLAIATPRSPACSTAARLGTPARPPGPRPCPRPPPPLPCPPPGPPGGDRAVRVGRTGRGPPRAHGDPRPGRDGVDRRRRRAGDLDVHYRRVNGDDAAVLFTGDSPYAVMVMDLTPDGDRVCGVYVVTNPDKLTRVHPDEDPVQ